jgi:hypothetical protein
VLAADVSIAPVTEPVADHSAAPRIAQQSEFDADANMPPAVDDRRAVFMRRLGIWGDELVAWFRLASTPR